MKIAQLPPLGISIRITVQRAGPGFESRWRQKHSQTLTGLHCTQSSIVAPNRPDMTKLLLKRT